MGFLLDFELKVSNAYPWLSVVSGVDRTGGNCCSDAACDNRVLPSAGEVAVYALDVDLSGGRFRYKQDLVMQMAAHDGAEMHHTDQNVLERV